MLIAVCVVGRIDEAARVDLPLRRSGATIIDLPIVSPSRAVTKRILRDDPSCLLYSILERTVLLLFRGHTRVGRISAAIDSQTAADEAQCGYEIIGCCMTGMKLESDLVIVFAVAGHAAKSSIVIVLWGFSFGIAIGFGFGSLCRLIRRPFLPPLPAHQLNLHPRHIVGYNTL